MDPRRAQPETVGELLFWSYANLAMAHAAIGDGLQEYGRLSYGIRAKLYKGFCTGTMCVGTLLDDERLKLDLPRCCCYCGATGKLTIDHLIPRRLGGIDSADNAVWACRRCNSSKGGRDLLEWMQHESRFPPLMLLRRYLKLSLAFAQQHDLLGASLERPPDVPFALASIPTRYPPPGELMVWMRPQRRRRSRSSQVGPRAHPHQFRSVLQSILPREYPCSTNASRRS